MKVTIACEKHGRDLLIYRSEDMSRPLFDTETGCDLSMVVAQLTCSRCNPPEPTYGPLTVEMVAEALERVEAITAGPPDPAAYYQPWARLVIRLLHWLDTPEVVRREDVCATPEDWRDWLLKLAREP